MLKRGSYIVTVISACLVCSERIKYIVSKPVQYLVAMSSPLALDAIQRLVFDTKTKDSDIRRCSVKDLEHVCRVRAIVVVPTGKRGAIKADYIAAIVKKVSGHSQFVMGVC